ncbi:acyltransferase [Microlunatus panaciterrae]|uniref:Peptidoglycan/LPS O-acetylase OafA/YrhL n=1 Tax=Microlunatus panaciterrae TaxID=400768 RepID=A0ABS2RKU9_9ACTN|nr:acyltransferase [Microlunatus panaciterrae]MBM7798796.1 peptidoglycan/LPS O-acetylase OafA/YrhL [Microlunatus panaciterrae]
MVLRQLAPPMVRLPWIDRLRVTVIAGVVVVHAASAYVVDVDWYYEERTTSAVSTLVLSFPVLLASIYGLAPLFLAAGWLTGSSVQRHGPAAFVRSRLLRLGLPLACYLLLIDPVTDYVGGLAQGETRSLASYLADPAGERDLGPTWFVAALLVFSLLFAGWRRLRPSRPRDPAALHSAPLVALGAVIAVTDFCFWQRWNYTGEAFWNLNWPHWPQSAGMFAFGVMAGERHWFEGVSSKFVRRCGVLALVGVLLLCGLAGLAVAQGDVREVAGGWHWQAAVFALLDGLVAVALGVLLVGWFRDRWAGPLGRTLNRAARGSYAAYLLHPPVLVALSILALGLAWPPELKFVLVAAAGIPACFAVGFLVTRVPYLRRVL